MAPRRPPISRDPAHSQQPAKEVTVDTLSIREKTPQVPADELLTAACEAMRLLQDRQAHTPEEMLDPRERKVLRQLRSAVRQSVVRGEGVEMA